MTTEEIDAIISPADESRDLVLQWIDSHGLTDSAALNARGNAITLNVTVSQAEDLLATKYNSFSKGLPNIKFLGHVRGKANAL